MPAGCECGNALAADGSPAVVQVVQGGGSELAARGVTATAHIAEGAIITCFGKLAWVPAGPSAHGEELQSIMHTLEEVEGERCQGDCDGLRRHHVRPGIYFRR